MKRELHFWVLGGDLRQAKLAELLLEDGHTVHVFGMEQLPEGERLPCREELKGIGKADCVILPLPTTVEDGMLHTPLSDRKLPLTAVLDELAPEQVICAGRVTQEMAVQANARGLILRDYLAREELAVANAVPTAEGAIQIAMEELPTTLYDARVLVIGFGRIGKLLAHRLAGLGARVTVSARTYEDLAWIEAYGYGSEHTDELEGWLCGYDLVINTVPAQVLTGPLLADLAPGCLVIDLASKPGGAGVEMGRHDKSARRISSQCRTKSIEGGILYARPPSPSLPIPPLPRNGQSKGRPLSPPLPG